MRWVKVNRFLFLFSFLNRVITIPTFFACKDMYDKSFYKYRMRVSNGCLDWTINRRFKQFVDMKDQLIHLYKQDLNKQQQKSYRPLPKLPSKTFKMLGQSNTSIKFLNERKVKLEQYMNLLKIHPWGCMQVPYLQFTGLLSTTRDTSAAEGRNVIHVSRLNEFVGLGKLKQRRCFVCVVVSCCLWWLWWLWWLWLLWLLWLLWWLWFRLRFTI